MVQSRVLHAVCFVALALSVVSSQPSKASILPCLNEKTTNSIGGCKTCRDIFCPTGTCVETPSGPVCKKVPVDPCAVILCAEGFKCIKGKCVRVSPVTCATTRCKPPTKCFDTPSGPICQSPCLDGLTRGPTGKCLTCKDIVCPKGSGCQLSLKKGPTCVDCDKIPCLAIFKPVCGSDGVTYSNDCKPRCLGIKFTEGPCKKTCKDIVCTKGLCIETPKGPVCKVTNPCLWVKCALGFTCVGGKCIPDRTCKNTLCRPPQKCIDGPKGPICQLPCLDGPPGECLSCKNVLCPKGTNCQVTPKGPKCINCNSIPCPKIYAPVCGSDGVTYANDCKPKCLGIKFTKGPCKKTCKDIACPSGACVETPKGPICKIISPGPCQWIKCAPGLKCVNGKCVKACNGFDCPIVKGL